LASENLMYVLMCGAARFLPASNAGGGSIED
jgi:hypothetical protein